jgi:hypothetical protein
VRISRAATLTQRLSMKLVQRQRISLLVLVRN